MLDEGDDAAREEGAIGVVVVRIALGVAALGEQCLLDGVLRKHHARATDFRTGRRNAKRDHQIEWCKPNTAPAHMSEDEFAAIPETMTVREVCLRLPPRKGFRDQFVIVVTTLLNAEQYTADQLTNLYGWRWQAAEINFRHLKTTLNMEMLTAKTPEMVRKEIWTHLLAYNLRRSVMEKAAPLINYQRALLSLQGTRQLFNQLVPLLANTTQDVQRRLYAHLLDDIVEDTLPVRPNRYEPRVVKRRPKPFPRMREPRAVLKARIAA